MSSIVEESLQEIASLILLLHDHYLKNAHGANNILYSLLQFVHNLGIQSMAFSLIDIETYRKLVMQESSYMSFGQFYDWIRKVASHVYEVNGTMALHKFLTVVIIPFASSTAALDAKIICSIPEVSTLKTMQQHIDMFRLWYLYCANLVQDQRKIHPVDMLWDKMISMPNILSLVTGARIVESLVSFGIVSPGLLTLEAIGSLIKDFKPIAIKPDDNDDIIEESHCFDFSEFVAVLGLLSELCPVNTDKCGMMMMLEAASNVLVKGMAKKVCQTMEVNAKVDSFRDLTVQHNFQQLKSSIILWMCHQCGATFFHDSAAEQTRNNIVESLENMSWKFRTSEVTALLSADGLHSNASSTMVERLLLNLCTLIELFSGIPFLSYISVLSCSTLTAKYSLYIAYACPTLLFCQNLCNNPQFLDGLYTSSGLTRVFDLKSQFVGIFDLCLDESAAGNGQSQCSVDHFIYICEEMELAPSLFPADFAVKTCDYVIGGNVCSQSTSGILVENIVSNALHKRMLTKDDIVAIIYILSRFCFDDNNQAAFIRCCENSYGDCDKADPMDTENSVPEAVRLEWFQLLVVRFFDYSKKKLALENESTAGDTGKHIAHEKDNSDAMLSLDESVQSNISLALNASTDSDLNVSVSAGGSSPVSTSKLLSKRSETVVSSNNNSLKTEMGFSIREVILLLSHYPLSNFKHNPWNLHKVLVENQTEDSTQHENNTALSVMFRSFCDYFHISASDLTKFFSSLFVTATPTDTPVVSNVKRTLSNNVRHIFACECLTIMSHKSILELLSSNEVLFQWEFLKCCGLDQYANSELNALLYSPVLNTSMYHDKCIDTSISYDAAIAWGIEVSGLDPDLVSKELYSTLCISHAFTMSQNTSHSGLNVVTFSPFIMYSIRIYSIRMSMIISNEALARPVTESELSTVGTCDPNIKKDFFQASIQNMLQYFSDKLTAVQKKLRLSILPFFTSEQLLDNREDLFGDKIVCCIMKLAINLFNDQNPISVSATAGQLSFLPPRPPHLFWDVARFQHFCTYMGLFSQRWTSELSLIIVMNAFDEYFRSNSNSAGGGKLGCVSPLPIKVNEEVAVQLMTSLVKIWNESNGVPESQSCTGDDGNRCSSYKIYQLVLSQIVSNSLHALDNVKNSNGRSQLDVSGGAPRSLEDLLRFGGAQLMLSVSNSQHLIRTCYRMCMDIDVANGVVVHEMISLEPRLLTCCHVLSCQHLIPFDIVVILAIKSLHRRWRASSAVDMYYPSTTDDMNVDNVDAYEWLLRRSNEKYTKISNLESVTLHFHEFEELLIRCAFQTYIQARGEVTTVRSSQVDSNKADSGWWDNRVDDCTMSFKLLQIQRKVTQEYCTVSNLLIEVAQRKSSDGQPWGTDFLTPFCVSLNNYLMELLPDQNNMFAVPALEEFRHQKVSELDANVLLDLNRYRENKHVANNIESYVSDGVTDEVSATSFVGDKHAVRKDEEFYLLRRSSGKAERNSLPAGSAVETSASLEIPHDGTATRASTKTNLRGKKLTTAIDGLLQGSKEALWPVYATYCSCGDSIDPGKLSGPNLFALLSKLGLLADHTKLSDIGILLHQISTHTISCSSFIISSHIVDKSTENVFECPSLSFEEFLIFLCAFSQLRYVGYICSPRSTNQQPASLSVGSRVVDDVQPHTASSNRSAEDEETMAWFDGWNIFMNSSASFRELLEECVLPMLKRFPLVAFPEDARHRDQYNSVFSLDVLIAIETVEDGMKGSGTPFSSKLVNSACIIEAVGKLELLPHVIDGDTINKLCADIMPKDVSTTSQSVSASISSEGGMKGLLMKDKGAGMLFPQWEWILCVIAYHTVESALRQRKSSKSLKARKRIPALVADVLQSITQTMFTNTA